MGFFHQAAAKFAKRPVQSPPASVQPALQKKPSSQKQPSQEHSSPQNPASALTPPRSIEELEQQMAREAQAAQRQTQVSSTVPSVYLKQILRRTLGATLLLGVPLGVLALINLPYAPVRQPIARSAPFLLMPSYINMDNHFRQAVTAVEEAKQLIDRATAPADLQLGEQKLKQAQTSLDQLPTWIWSELPNTQQWWYHWRMNSSGFNSARAEIGRLRSKLFQEQNAQVALTEAEQDLSAARQQYQEAPTSEKQAALLVWQDAQDKLRQIPAATLAGKMAQQKLEIAERDFQALGGTTTGNSQTMAFIAAAQQFARQAATRAQNPPHSVEHWQQVKILWQQAISQLQQVSIQDPTGYTEARKLLATYTTYHGQIEERWQAEANATAALQQAKLKIADLIAATSTTAKPAQRNNTASQLQRIIDQLETIDTGTTAYPEAQQLLQSARKKAKQLQES